MVISANPIPDFVPNWIGGAERSAAADEALDKLNPATGRKLSRFARSRAVDVAAAVDAAQAAQPVWGDTPPVQRGMILGEVVAALRAQRDEVARTVALETGKSLREALGETDGAIALGTFMASEGQRLYGRTMASGVLNRTAMTIRRPVGVAGLILAANTPIANVAWKVFPALVCGNAAVLKAPEDAPAAAWLFGRIAHSAGLPAGILNIIQGLGIEAGAPIVEHPSVGVLSFTGSTAVGRWIAEAGGKRLAKVSLELGGKNPFVVCDDADLVQAVHWATLSAFSNAGQRCASGSRIIVFDSVFDEFRDRLVEATTKLKVGAGDDDDFGPVINEKHVTAMVAAVRRARDAGASVLTGGERLTDPAHREGFFLAPTLVEGAESDAEISVSELFGPIATLSRVPDFTAAVALANDSPYGLTACIHTRNFDRAMEFVRRAHVGVAVVNGGTYGSEPHMPFGGVKQSGNGTREPGTEALDIYSDLRDVYLHTNPARV
jgi:acyl-CoA reductase-like NAD-dependent aldehyde dehydrogenase